jgi:hypothetical protein
MRPDAYDHKLVFGRHCSVLERLSFPLGNGQFHFFRLAKRFSQFRKVGLEPFQLTSDSPAKQCRLDEDDPV